MQGNLFLVASGIEFTRRVGFKCLRASPTQKKWMKSDTVRGGSAEFSLSIYQCKESLFISSFMGESSQLKIRHINLQRILCWTFLSEPACNSMDLHLLVGKVQICKYSFCQFHGDAYFYITGNDSWKKWIKIVKAIKENLWCTNIANPPLQNTVTSKTHCT